MTSAPSLARATAADRILSDPGARHETGSTVALAGAPDRQRLDNRRGQLQPGTLPPLPRVREEEKHRRNPLCELRSSPADGGRLTAERFAKCKSAAASGDGCDFQSIDLK
jgi:hypothetical protein